MKHDPRKDLASAADLAAVAKDGWDGDSEGFVVAVQEAKDPELQAVLQEHASHRAEVGLGIPMPK